MICIDAWMFAGDCSAQVDEAYTAELFRGLGDGVQTPDFMYLATFVGRCMGDPENPPLGEAFFYQTVIRNGTGGEILSCGGGGT